MFVNSPDLPPPWSKRTTALLAGIFVAVLVLLGLGFAATVYYFYRRRQLRMDYMSLFSINT